MSTPSRPNRPCTLTRVVSFLLLLAALVSVAPQGSRAQAPAPAAAVAHDPKDISGDWQGTLQLPDGKAFRSVIRVARAEKGWTGKFISIDQNPMPQTISVTLTGSVVKYTFDLASIVYTGTLSADGNTMTGTSTQGAGAPIPLTYVRATKETAWEIPAPPAPMKMMAADAKPGFDVATIKPNDSGGATLQQLTLNGRDFVTRNASLQDLISFAYQVNVKQIVNAPDWSSKDRYDIKGVPDTDGAPNPAQLRMMIQKLIVERFQLKFHNEKRDLSAYVVTIAKGGEKLKATEMTGPLPGIGFLLRPGGMGASARNATVSDFTGFLQNIVLDRPVVDRTGLTGRYDFTVTFTPDDTQFNGHPPQIPKPAEGSDVVAAPDLFTAMQAQLGLKVEAQKTPVEVMAVESVAKPTAN